MPCGELIRGKEAIAHRPGQPERYLAKALDARVDCTVVIAVSQRLVGGDHPDTLVSVDTAQAGAVVYCG